ncbi:dihydropteroate synthase [Alicyclobacillus acidoterrestris]|uniref:Dihydropteroate synthase n=1 Tax=Alicyclobacillus acidoterrestris (strain ATCC 49025 / DSM 3922 / CIP 106132 / NCIMB 13137 / GD3B) TaxID=1356854 RepID=A0A9E6ZHX8_ALIAG|nr:dihydropteroate synthase [Alicyclobacillus acidoterrestris]UNO49258.1 dihydropteroate synthase [Alicyclobacillus acidoterrestris]
MNVRVMGILNVTPDSFSDGGRYAEPSAAIQRAYEMIEDGVDILDIGAESTRPGYTPLDAETEWARLEPVLRALLPNVSVPVSVDTYHAETAARAIDVGVAIINDISACGDKDMPRVLQGNAAQYVYMHNRPQVDSALSVSDIVAETRAGIERLLDAGLDPSRLIVDPGVGFAKTYTQNLSCIRHIEQFCQLGYPVLLGTSRKRFIGHALGLEVDERLEGSLATVAYGVLHGATIVRVHDVRETVRMCRMLEAIHHVDAR